NKKHLKEKKFIKSILNKYKINNFIFLEDFNDIKKLINISDVVVYPTLDMNEKQEIPMILLESLSMEKPIIITDMVPLNEILKSNCGKKINKGDFYKLSKEILNLKNNKKLRLKMGKNGRKMVIKYFNIINTAKEYEKLYSRI
ncbi:MAG: glycosyltransferase, partial [Nanoarchaeota archaeon]